MPINGQTEIVGIIGDPIHHTKSPVIHNAAFEALGKNCAYVPFHVRPDDVESAIAGIWALGIRGVNVTVPHKQSVIPFLDELSADAREIGAVNTIVNHEGTLIGHNTDAPGFVKSLQDDHQFTCKGKRVSIIGAGGSARAIAIGLKRAGISHLSLINRTKATAAELAQTVADGQFVPDCFEPDSSDAVATLANSDLIVQTTSVGMSPNNQATPVTDFSWVRSGQLVIDIIYSPETTLFLSTCAKNGAKIGNGAGMLIAQAALAFELFTNTAAPIPVMRKAFYEQ